MGVGTAPLCLEVLGEKAGQVRRDRVIKCTKSRKRNLGLRFKRPSSIFAARTERRIPLTEWDNWPFILLM